MPLKGGKRGKRGKPPVKKAAPAVKPAAPAKAPVATKALMEEGPAAEPAAATPAEERKPVKPMVLEPPEKEEPVSPIALPKADKKAPPKKKAAGSPPPRVKKTAEPPAEEDADLSVPEPVSRGADLVEALDVSEDAPTSVFPGGAVESAPVELSLADGVVMPEPEAAPMRADDFVPRSEPAEPAEATLAPVAEPRAAEEPVASAPKRTLKFNNPGDTQNAHGFTFAYVKDAGVNSMVFSISGGKKESQIDISKDVPTAVSNETSDGKPVRLVITYKGVGTGRTKMVEVEFKGLESALSSTTSRAKAAASSTLSKMPSRWAHIADVLPIALAPVAAWFLYLPGVKEVLGTTGQHAAALGTAFIAAAVGLWSFIERMRNNQRV